MKVNYLDGNNKNLGGRFQYLHKKEVKKKYEKLIAIKKKNYFYDLFLRGILIILFFIMGVVYREVVINKTQPEISTFIYEGKILSKEDMEKILRTKFQLGESFEKKGDNRNSYLNYLKAEKIALKLENKKFQRKYYL